MTDKELKKEVDDFLKDPVFGKFLNRNAATALAIHIAQWQKEHLWKDVQGDDLPDYDREVIVLRNKSGNIEFPFPGYVSFAHRPKPEGYNAKSVTTGEVFCYEVQTYGKGGWNQPDVVWWLDLPLPYEKEGEK